MSRSERWNTDSEIKRRLNNTTDSKVGAGPILYYENGDKYTDDGESHIAVIGCTGKGKSQCCSLPYIREVIEKGESFIALDPKGEGFKNTSCYIPGNYQLFCIDFRYPRKSPTKWNPLSTPYRLFRSDDPDETDIACSIVSELCSGVYPYDGKSDKFWPDSAAQYAKGLIYALFETFPEDMVNLNNVSIMMEQSEVKFGGSTILKTFYDSLPSDSLAKRNLAPYATAPNDTRASIHSVAASGIEVFSRSKGLMEMLGEDNLNIMDIDVERPFACYVITPDESDVYDSLSGLLISQLTQHLIRVAQDKGGKLPIRVNIILEELGSTGKSIPSLPNLCVAGRSRNIRLMLILQSYSQLKDVYGSSKAETIGSSIGITVGFSTNNWETLNEWSQRCGERQLERNGHLLKEPLITASQLAAMPTGSALIMIDSQYKYIAHLPRYEKMYDNSKWTPPIYQAEKSVKELKSLDFVEIVKEMKRQKLMASMESTPEERIKPPIMMPNPFMTNPQMDVDSLIAKIDAQIAEIEAEEENERKKQEKSMKYHVVITECSGDKMLIAQLIAEAIGVSAKKAANRLEALPTVIPFRLKKDALKFVKEINYAGGKAVLKTKQERS